MAFAFVLDGMMALPPERKVNANLLLLTMGTLVGLQRLQAYGSNLSFNDGVPCLAYSLTYV